VSTQRQAAAFELKDLSKVYGEGDSEVRALDGVSLRIEPGDFVAIMGASGSGKSTCMNVIGCLDVPTSGQYLFHGVDVTRLDQDQRARLRRAYLGFIFQGFNLLARTSALDNVELPLVYRGVSAAERRERAMGALELVGLADRAHHAPAELSGGQQQRVAIARALVCNPAMLLADEPTGNLDSARTTDILELLVELNRVRGLTIVMVTHEPEVASYVRRVITFRDGRIVDDHPQPEKA
jgi:putative ABC transport system ATP-binding protein